MYILGILKKYAFSIIKYLFTVIFLAIISVETHRAEYFIFGLLELLFIFSLSDFLLRKNRGFLILHDVLMLFFNAQVLMIHFANSYVSLVMLDNMDSLEDIGGKTTVYAVGVVIVFVMSFIPVKTVGKHGHGIDLLFAPIVMLELVLFPTLEIPVTPSMGYAMLYNQWADAKAMERMKAEYLASLEQGGVLDTALESEETANDGTSTGADATSAPAEDSRSQSAGELKNGDEADEREEEVYIPVEERLDVLFPVGEDIPHDTLAEGTNVIVIFVEGLSEDVVTDSRGIMSNLNEWQNHTINVINYYDHTAATFRALQGQLYSGCVENNYDIPVSQSIMTVLRSHGYYTSFINTEPLNDLFKDYLESMDFDEVISDTSMPYGVLASMRDTEAYELLFDKAMEYEETGVPFFLSMYSFGTHATFDSAGERYGDGTDPALNKFYDADCQIGLFLEKFQNSPLASNTMLIITADHASYMDEDMRNAFPDMNRVDGFCDEIPLMIYYQGFTEQIDAQGRNSLDMAPTILDLLGIEKPETFLGESLFRAKNADTYMDSFYYLPGTFYYTGADKVELAASDVERYIKNQMMIYFATCY